MLKEQPMKNLFVVKKIVIYNEKGLPNRTYKVGATIKGQYDGLLGGYRCVTDDKNEFVAFYDEVIVC